MHHRDLLFRHSLKTTHGIRIATRFEADWIHRSLGIPSLAPTNHGLDFSGLIAPDAVGQMGRPRGSDPKNVFTHPQRTGVVLIHGIEPTQVIGGAGRPNGVVMAAVITMLLMTFGLALVMLVMIVMIVMLMVLVMITMALMHRSAIGHGVMLMALVLR